MKTSRTLIIAAITLTFLIEIAMAVPIPDSIFYGRVLGEDGKATAFTEVIGRLHGAASDIDPETGEEQNPIIARSGVVEDEELGEIYVLRIPRDDGAGLEDKGRLATLAGDKLYILVDGDVVDETTLDGIEVSPAVSDVRSMNLNGPDCPNLKDCDEDGLNDAWEQQIIHADPNDAITSIDDVNATDDFDRDGLTNLQEFESNSDPTTPDALIDPPGSIYEIIAFDYDTCLEAANADNSVAHAACHDGSSQSWRIEASGNEFFKISTVDGQNCLTAPEIAIPEGTNITQTACTGDDTQLWSVDRVGDLYEIVSAHNDHCLTAIAPDSTGSGDLFEAPCTTGVNPQWVLFPKNLDEVYEDAEDGLTHGWRVYDDDPAGASVASVFDESIQSQVIELSGSGSDNGYWLTKEDNSDWRNLSHRKISWDMRFSEPFTVYVNVETTAGHRYLQYSALDRDLLGDDRYVHHGLGNQVLDGQWQTITRDLVADLHEAQPDVDLLEVNGFLIRGSGRIDNVKLTFKIPEITVYEDAEDGGIAGWETYLGDPLDADIINIPDAERKSQVIELIGAGTDHGYRLRNSDGTPWRNSTEFNLSWDIRSSEPFIVYVEVMTTAGQRYLQYNMLENDLLGDGRYILHGIGIDKANGSWHTITRDLVADLHEAQPNVDLLEVNGFLIRGHVRVDNIQLQAGK